MWTPLGSTVLGVMSRRFRGDGGRLAWSPPVGWVGSSSSCPGVRTWPNGRPSGSDISSAPSKRIPSVSVRAPSRPWYSRAVGLSGYRAVGAPALRRRASAPGAYVIRDERIASTRPPGGCRRPTSARRAARGRLLCTITTTAAGAWPCARLVVCCFR